jgi:hypothetical protein
MLTNARGTYTFQGRPIPVAGDDIAIDGRDRHMFTCGRFGLAVGFTPISGPPVVFTRSKHCLQVDQQFELPKGNTLQVSKAVRLQCLQLGVAPEWFAMDRTGNGGVPHDYLKATWSEEVIGVDFSKPATEIKILEEDTYTPLELYQGIVTEVWFALRKWLEFGLVAFAPGCKQDPLFSELLGRRYEQEVGKKLRVEKKDAYCARAGRSPDAADSVTILLHAVRMSGKDMASMTGQRRRDEEHRSETAIRHGIIDTPEFVDVSKY